MRPIRTDGRSSENTHARKEIPIQTARSPGRTAGQKMCSKFKLRQLEIPEDYGVKDPSDFLEKYGNQELKKLLKKLIKDAKNN